MRTAILDLVYVGLGGFIGSIGRYLAAGAVHQIFPSSYFPIGTAVVNIIGCFLIGVLTGLAELRNLLSPEMRTFLLIGMLGGDSRPFQPSATKPLLLCGTVSFYMPLAMSWFRSSLVCRASGLAIT